MDSHSSVTLLAARKRFALACIVFPSIALAAGAPPPSPVDPATVDVGHPTGHVHDHGNQTWPPQPPGMQNPVLLGDPGQESLIAEARARRADAGGRLAAARPDVRQALGARYRRATVVEDSDDSGVVRASRLVYFSYSKNSTVEVTVDDRRVLSLRTMPATEYQPEITDAEIGEAEGIARAHFTTLGQERVAQLQAFGILAYQPTGKGFYPTRVLYISFHRNSDSPPEYVAWVDLTRQRVLRARQEGQ